MYLIGGLVTDVRQGFYDLKPLTMTSEGADIFINKITGTSWWMAPHSQTNVGQYYHVWPCPSRTGSTTTLTSGITDTVLSIPVADGSLFMAYGFLGIDDEIIRYANTPSGAGSITNVIRGQAGTRAAAHSSGATVTELNLMFMVNRLPRPLLIEDDPVEIPQQLWPMIELYVMSKVRETEQQHEIAQTMMNAFVQLVERMANKSQLVKPRQGLQVRATPFGPMLYNGRTYIP